MLQPRARLEVVTCTNRENQQQLPDWNHVNLLNLFLWARELVQAQPKRIVVAVAFGLSVQTLTRSQFQEFT